MTTLTPKQIVQELDKFIIGQQDAKRAVAVALRNRWRRMQLDPALRGEVTPKNILMIGPTGVGKTEISRRLAKLANAPFIKVEATKFTEVGYVGRDVDSIIRDLVESALKMIREVELNKQQTKAQERAEERILDVLAVGQDGVKDSAGRQFMRKKLREGELDAKEIEIDVAGVSFGVEIMAPPGMEEMTSQLQNMFSSLSSNQRKRRRMSVKDAMRQITEEEGERLINQDDLKARAVQEVEQNGIVFIDELDKVCRGRNDQRGGADVSREGVQRDLLPLIEGSTVSTKYGMVKTDHILFIASGAFHLSKPSDLIPELQGRLPIRVELTPLTPEDFERILIEPDYSLTRQYQELLKTENVHIEFTADGIRRLAEIAWQVNEKIENIGARRLHTVMEKLLDDVSYQASDQPGMKVTIDKAFVNSHLGDLAADQDLSRYIL